METWLSRTALLFGEGATSRLALCRVAVFGLGGVGGYCVEALARSGVGALTLIDGDKVDETNLNRQILATRDTVGMWKIDAARARVAQINPACAVETFRTFVLPETIGEFDFARFDFVVDAIDTVSGKLAIAMAAKAANVPVISAMGAGNKLDPTLFRVADISETSVCPLARVMRRELKKRGIEHLRVVYSEEEPQQTAPRAPYSAEEPKKAEGRAPGSNAFVPATVGLILAGEVVKALIAKTP